MKKFLKKNTSLTVLTIVYGRMCLNLVFTYGWLGRSKLRQKQKDLERHLLFKF